MADEGELSRAVATLSDRVAEFGRALGDLRAELVRRDVYEAQRQADRAEVARLRADVDRLEREADEREAARAKDRAGIQRANWGAVLACIGTIVAGVVTQVILR